jgi:hypothetical protein
MDMDYNTYNTIPKIILATGYRFFREYFNLGKTGWFMEIPNMG